MTTLCWLFPCGFWGLLTFPGLFHWGLFTGLLTELSGITIGFSALPNGGTGLLLWEPLDIGYPLPGLLDAPGILELYTEPDAEGEPDAEFPLVVTLLGNK